MAAGHEVTGIARSSEKEALLASLGARPARVGLFDPVALRDAVAGHDAVVNLATKIPPVSKMAQMSAWEENERIRREGSGHLVDAAIAAGATVFVQESIAFLYGEHGDEWVDAASTSWAPSTVQRRHEDGGGERRPVHRARRSGCRVALRSVLRTRERPDARARAKPPRRGVAGDIGPADSYAPMIDADDVGSAVVAALAAPAGTYDIVDDEPLTRSEQDRALAAAVGRRRLWRAPGVDEAQGRRAA